jgi:CBS domain-containing protein
MSAVYNVIEVFTSEEARSDGKPVADAIIDVLRDARIAARCFVSRGHAGYYESGEVASARLEVLSSNLPLKIEVILPAPELDQVLDRITQIVTDGIVVVEEMEVHSHRSRYRLIPRQLLVRDIMTTPAVSVARKTAVDEIVRLLLSSEFNGVPVVDDHNRPVGIITQGDLVGRAGMPLRLGLIDEAGEGVTSDFRERARKITAEDVMTTPVKTIRSDRPVSEVVELMRKHGLKRFPVTDEDGTLAGMVTRLDVFRMAFSGRSHDSRGRDVCYVDWEGMPRVSDCMTRETGTVRPDASIGEVLRSLNERSVQRIAVVDEDQRLLGLLTDRDILTAIGHRPRGRIREIIDHFPLPRRKASDAGEITLDTTAGEIMKTDLITVAENATLDEALRLMVEHALKRLPVVDEGGRYRGMVSRNALLRLSIPD